MADAIVNDWIAEYNSLQPEEIRSFASQHENNHEVSTALYTILNDRNKYFDLLHPICNQLYNFYRSNEAELKCFTLQFIPILIYLYLNAVANGEKRNYRSVETLLLSVYNIEICNEDGQMKTVNFRMPVLAHPSIYHEEKNLQPSDLKRWEDHSNKEITWGPKPQVEVINAQNRLTVMSALLFIFNQQLSMIHKPALYHMCKVTSQIVSQGFAKQGHHYRTSYGSDPTNTNTTNQLSSPVSSSIKSNPRIPISQQFLLELLHAIYFAMFNEFASAAIQAVEDIHNRSCYELFSDVCIVTNAIRNSLHANPSGQPSDGPMGISVALTPATPTVTVSKSMITNASFRTKKLPDDLEMERVLNLQATQDEMMKKLSMIEKDGVMSSSGESFHIASPKMDKKKMESLSSNAKRHHWKNWGWKHSPAKSHSIEEEPSPESPRNSQQSSKSSTPNNSPKHKCKSVNESKPSVNINETLLSAPFRRKKSPSNLKTDAKSKVEIRSSAGARLFTMFDGKDNFNNSDESDEFHTLLTNGRPASIHILQSDNRDEY